MSNQHPIHTGSTPNRFVTANQIAQTNEASEIERKLRLEEEKQQFLLLEKKKKEEEDKKKREREEQEKKKEEEERKQKEEYERIGKWKSTKAPDFEGNIFEASAKGKLTSI